MRAIQIAKGGYILSSLAFCVAGILLLLHPEVSASVLCKVMGVLLLVCGVIKIWGYLSKDLYRLAFQFDLAFGILAVAIGLLMLLRSNTVIRFLNFVIGIVILTDGLFKIQTSIDAKRFGLAKWWMIALIAVVTSILGQLIVLDPFQNSGVLGTMMLLGCTLLMEGLLNLCVAVYTVKILKQAKTQETLFEHEIWEEKHD